MGDRVYILLNISSYISLGISGRIMIYILEKICKQELLANATRKRRIPLRLPAAAAILEMIDIHSRDRRWTFM